MCGVEGHPGGVGVGEEQPSGPFVCNLPRVQGPGAGDEYIWIFAVFWRSVFRFKLFYSVIINNFVTVLRHLFAFRARRPFWTRSPCDGV